MLSYYLGSDSKRADLEGATRKELSRVYLLRLCFG